MFWIGAVALTACMFVSPQRNGEGLPAKDEHTFFNLPENCTCCHATEDRSGGIEPHQFTIDITENCTGCHTAEQIGRSHPVDVPVSERFPDIEVDASLPVDQQQRITCGTCHNPHLAGYSPERYASGQVAAGTRVEAGVEVAYYRSYRLRLHAPEAGNDPTCAGCHRKYF
jgi:hypothetical protein